MDSSLDSISNEVVKFDPIFIEDVLTISKEKFDRLRLKPASSRRAEFSTKERRIYDGHKNTVHASTILIYKGNVNDNLNIYFELFFGDDDLDFGANITFNVKSANYSVKDNKARKVTPDESTYDSQRWSNVLCTFSDVLNPKKNFFEDGKLTIHIRAMIFDKPDDHRVEIYSPLGSFLWERDDRDFVISVGKKNKPKTDIMIHKCVLASRSSVFDAMLTHNMKEKTENKLEIIDYGAEVVQAAVEYFYDQETYESLSIEPLIDLLFFADRYFINDLKKDIKHLLIFRLYPDTIVQIANASVILTLDEVKQACIKLLNLYINQKIPYDNAETLDEEIKDELNEETDADPESFYYSSSDED